LLHAFPEFKDLKKGRPDMVSKINRDFFFATCRSDLFDSSLNQTQLTGLTALLNYWEGKYADRDDRWLAYVLATAYHEVDRRMKPINEYGTKAYFMRNYDKTGNSRKAAELGNTEVGDGARYHGRGFVQLTGRRNYQDWSNRLGINLITNPDKALDLGIATKIIFDGMVLGTFTGRQLSQYFNPTTADWTNARRIVNGTNKANLISGYGLSFYKAISYTV
jgi:putative chitinase